MSLVTHYVVAELESEGLRTPEPSWRFGLMMKRARLFLNG